MFYSTLNNNHNLKYNPFKSCIVPRPIGWISSLNKDKKVNIAPFSYFNAVADIPPTIMFASSFKENGAHKDTLVNILEHKEFVVNIASYDSRELLNLSSLELPYEVSEAEHFNIDLEPSYLISTPRIKEAKIALECEFIKNVELDASSIITFGKVIGVYIEDHILTEGKIDIAKLKPIARLGYDEYALIDNIFKMKRPK